MFKNIKDKIKDYVLREGAYEGRARLYVDYGQKLVDQSGFEDFNELLVEVRQQQEEQKRRGSRGRDLEFDRLTLCFLNSTFWNYDSYEDEKGRVSERILSNMSDHTMTAASVANNLERMSNAFLNRENQYLKEKVILHQQLRSMVNFLQLDEYPFVWQLIPLVLLKELENNDDKILRFATDYTEEDVLYRDEVEQSVRHKLEYLDGEYESGRILSSAEYIGLVREVTDLVSRRELPMRIRKLQLSERGSLKSGDSYKFVTYGISRISWEYEKKGVSRNLWIEYLVRKIGKEPGVLRKKFTDEPDGWSEKMRGRQGNRK